MRDIYYGTESTMNLANPVRFWSSWQPDKPCLKFHDQHLSWREIDRRSNALANGLIGAGLQHGDRVTMLSGNRPEYVEAIIGTFKAGGVVVPLNVRLTAGELAYMIGDCRPRMMIADDALAPLASEAIRLAASDCGLVVIGEASGSSYASLLGDPGHDPAIAIGRDDVAFICYTSGTTGNPKGAMLSHHNAFALAESRIYANRVTSDFVIYIPAPMSFAGSVLSNWVPCYICGAVLLLDDAVDPLRTLKAMSEHRANLLGAVPYVWEGMLNHPDFAQHDTSSLKVGAIGGATVTPSLLERLQAQGIAVSAAYGLTEACGISAWMPSHRMLEKVDSCGIPLMNTEMRIVDPDNADELVDRPPGEAGELLLKGPTVMLGYWEKPEATRETLVDGWLRTGDIARVDDEGYLYILDRAKDMLISGGINVYPAEIEAVLFTLDGVGECAVIGVPDDTWGEVPLAVLVPLPGGKPDLEALRDLCSAKLADYKRPRYVVLRREPLPRSMASKILKRQLREEYGDPASWGERRVYKRTTS